MATLAVLSASRFFHFSPEQATPARINLSRVLELASSRRCVLLGEVHENASAVGLQEAIQGCLLERVKSQSTPGVLHIVMEHFNFEMQGELDSFVRGEVSFSQLESRYHEMGIEGHNLTAYKSILNKALMFPDAVRVHGGFIPRQYAKALFNAEEDKVIAAATEKGYIPPGVTLDGTDVHYSVFEAMFGDINTSAEDQSSADSLSYPRAVAAEPANRYRRIFRAQVLKDEAMAYRIGQIVQKAGNTDKIMVICGTGHILYGCGVRERLHRHVPEIAQDSLSIILGQGWNELDEGADAAAAASKYGKLQNCHTLGGVIEPAAADIVMVSDVQSS